MKKQFIKDIIDTYLQKCVDRGINSAPIQIESEMADQHQDKNADWKTWFPIDSQVTDAEIEEFEKQIGYKLPEDYKTFLKHKHFYHLYISEVSFCSHPIHSWKDSQINMIFDGAPTEFLIEKGYVPFADWSDWGLLCFDTNRNKEDHNYPIVLWDHEIDDKVQDRYEDFYDMLTELDFDEKDSTTQN